MTKTTDLTLRYRVGAYERECVQYWLDREKELIGVESKYCPHKVYTRSITGYICVRCGVKVFDYDEEEKDIKEQGKIELSITDYDLIQELDQKSDSWWIEPSPKQEISFCDKIKNLFKRKA